MAAALERCPGEKALLNLKARLGRLREKAENERRIREAKVRGRVKRMGRILRSAG